MIMGKTIKPITLQEADVIIDLNSILHKEDLKYFVGGVENTLMSYFCYVWNCNEPFCPSMNEYECNGGSPEECTSRCDEVYYNYENVYCFCE